MPTTNELVQKQLVKIRRDVEDLWRVLRTDPKEQARKERAWALLTGALAAATTAAARQAATKIWVRATGEPPPPLQDAAREAAKIREEASV